MSAALATLVQVCQQAAADVVWVQGAGGNVSVKSDDAERLWIKASGVRLGDVRSDAGYVELELPRARAALHAGDAAALAASVVAGDGRPSLETAFHALLDSRVVLHVHDVYLNAFACMRDGRHEAAARLGSQVAWVDYVPPGDALGFAVFEAVARHAAQHGAPPTAILLANHGVVVAAEDGETALGQLRALDAQAKARFGSLGPSWCARCAPDPRASELCLALDAALAGRTALRAEPAHWGALVSASSGCPSTGALVPDDAVFGIHGIRQVAADPGRALSQIDLRADRQVLWVDELGFVLLGRSASTRATMQEMLLANVLVHRLLSGHGEPLTLSAAQVAHLLGMDAEKYRQTAVAARAEGAR